MSKAVEASYIDDHGADNIQCVSFAGAGYMNFEVRYIGIGDSAHEALDDCLDQAACDGWDVVFFENNLSKQIPGSILNNNPHDVALPEDYNEDWTYHVVLYLK